MFSCEFCEISKNTIFIEHLRGTASVLHENYHAIENDKNLCKIFKSRPAVAFRRMKTISNHLLREAGIIPNGKERNET